ncbi:hypothetical protein OVS_01870 [Mycoplasma ovis str. Michigan]|uniref:Uncharacterized protein n=1 Tax=Mycoplasma ovis str. Michigan TaxID=1415773 RepID=A0ABM5P199_9MOLU|nr:hypothetical protein [Mycoplasma ovis]AHC40256.1 hypothetical protein OVS_01870 [Mycoplasma ovis str. Michigan]
MAGLFKLFGLVAFCKWLSKKSRWNNFENPTNKQETKKYLKIEHGLNKWLTIWKKILRWFKILKFFQLGLCIVSLITLPVGCLVSSASHWSFGIFGVYTFFTYFIYYLYCSQSRELLKYKTKSNEGLHLQKCKSTVRLSLFFSLLPFVFLFGYKPFDYVNYSLSELVDTETLKNMNPHLFEKKLTNLNKKPEELQGLSVDLEEFQQPTDLI